MCVYLGPCASVCHYTFMHFCLHMFLHMSMLRASACEPAHLKDRCLYSCIKPQNLKIIAHSKLYTIKSSVGHGKNIYWTTCLAFPWDAFFPSVLSEACCYGSNPPTSSASPLVYCCSSVATPPPSLYALLKEPTMIGFLRCMYTP